MAFPASANTLASHRVMLFESLAFQLHSSVVRKVIFHPASAGSNCFKPVRMEMLSHHPDDPPKFKTHLDYAAKKLHAGIPDSVQKFPWEETGSAVTKQLLTLLQEALKWSLAACFILGFLSDVVYTIARDKELWIPFGLLSGCVVAEFLKEASRELSPLSQESGKTWQFLGMGFLFVLIRIIIICNSAEPPEFLLHAANGGLMHVLWQWKNSSGHDQGDSRTNVTSENPCISQYVED